GGPWGRLTPRSSVGTKHAEAGTASVAGLPSRSAIVFVGAPFAASSPSLGWVVSRSDDCGVSAHPVRGPRTSWPFDVTIPEQFGPAPAVLSARIDAPSLIVPVSD